MMTAEFMLSKRPVLRFTAALFFLLKLFSSHIYCIPKQIQFYVQCLQCQISSTAPAKPAVLNQFYVQCLQCQISSTVPAVPTVLNQIGVRYLQCQISSTVSSVLNQFYVQCLQCQISFTVPN